MGSTGSVNPLEKVNEVDVELIMNNLLTNVEMDMDEAIFQRQLRMISIFLQSQCPYKNPQISTQSILSPLLKLFYHGQFENLIHKLLNFLDKRHEALEGSLAVLQNLQEWEMLTNLIKFILVCVNIRIRKFYQAAPKAKDLDEESKACIVSLLKNQYRQISSPLQSYPNKTSLFQSLTQIINKTIRNLNGILGSNTSYHIFKEHLQASFILYLQLFYLKDEKMLTVVKQGKKDHICIGTYMLATSINYKKPALYEISVLFLNSLLQNQHHQEIYSIKTLFLKNLPIIPCQDIYQQILYLAVYALSKRNSQKFVWRSFRTIKMLQVLLNVVVLPDDPKFFYFLEEACKRTDTLEIERVFMHHLIVSIVKEKLMKTDVLGKFIKIGDGDFDLRTTKGRKRFESQFIYSQYCQFMGEASQQFAFLSQSYIFTIICHQIDPNYKDNYKQWSLLIKYIEDKRKNQSEYVVHQQKMLQKQ